MNGIGIGGGGGKKKKRSRSTLEKMMRKGGGDTLEENHPHVHYKGLLGSEEDILAGDVVMDDGLKY